MKTEKEKLVITIVCVVLGLVILAEINNGLSSDSANAGNPVSTATRETAGENDNKKSSSRKDKINAWVCAQDYVERQLKSPGSAKFCSYRDASVSYSSSTDKYTISGWVDAENSFGATLRSNFTVTLKLTEDGYTDASGSIS